MKWVSAICGPDDQEHDLVESVRKCKSVLETGLAGKSIDLLIAFVSPHYREEFPDFPALIQKELSPRVMMGCSAGGIIGGGQEIEQKRSVALMAANLPDVELTPFHLTNEMLPDLDDGQTKWEELVKVKSSDNPSFIVIPEPFSFQTDILVQGMDFAFPGCVKVGGLASGASQPGENMLFLNEECFSSGLVGVAVTGNVVVDTVVAQGCKPVGKPLRITKCNRNVLFELNGQPAVMALKSMIEDMSEQDRELVKDSIFLGLVMDETKEDFASGDFLIRNILGIEPNSGALVIGELLRTERTVQFHVRDAATSADDLRFLLKRYKDDTLQGGELSASGALLFSCLGRGEYLYGRENHDSDCFRSYLGMVPLAGFFCNGEIGPVGQSTFLHGYTSSFGIFRAKEPVS